MIYGQLAGMRIVIMFESLFFEKISVYLAENKRKAALEAEITNMAIKAIDNTLHTTGHGEHFIPKPPDEQVPGEQLERRLDAIYDEEPLGFKINSLESRATMLAQDPLEEINIRDGSVKRITYISAKLDPKLKTKLIEFLKERKYFFAWDHDENPGLKRDLVELRLPIK